LLNREERKERKEHPFVRDTQKTIAVSERSWWSLWFNRAFEIRFLYLQRPELALQPQSVAPPGLNFQFLSSFPGLTRQAEYLSRLRRFPDC